MASNTTQYTTQTRLIPRKVFYTGTDALILGQGLCFERDYTATGTGLTATDPTGVRDKRVELPNVDNNYDFAGVTSQAYAAATAGQWIIIFEPGSICEVAVGETTVIHTGHLTCTAGGGGAGLFIAKGFRGRGSMVPLQTTPTASDSIAEGVILNNMVSTGSITATGTMTDTTAFGNVVVGDRVYILGGLEINTQGSMPTQGVYAVTEVTSSTVIVMSGYTAGATMHVTYIIVRGKPTVLAKLEEGPESGLVEIYNTDEGAVTDIMIGGFTYFIFVDFSANMTAVLADGTFMGQLKGFYLIGTMQSDDIVITVTSGQMLTAVDIIDTQGTADGTPKALATALFDTAADELVLEWLGVIDGEWRERYVQNATLA